MSTSQNQRRRGRSGGSGVAAGRGSDVSAGSDSSGSDALAGLRQAVSDLDPGAFARCFSDTGWVRVPRPEGDVVLRGRGEIEHLGHELGRGLRNLTWTPSQRFVAAGQVVEEAVARAQTTGDPTPGDPALGDSTTSDPALGDPALEAEIRVPMRVVAALDPSGGIGSLTVWVDWAALHDPLGVDSARGAASALVAQARARDARGLQVIVSEPGAAPVPPIAVMPVPRAPGSGRPPAVTLWWKQHRATLAGSAMALAAAAVIGWVAVNALRPLLDDETVATGPGSGPAASASVGVDQGSGGAGGASPEPSTTGSTSTRPQIVPEKLKSKPKVQDGDPVTIKSDVLFKINSFDITATSGQELRLLARKVQSQQRDGNIQINGYTDSVGTLRENLVLSRRRANAVATALQDEFAKLSGVDVSLSPQGFGESDPIDTNNTTAGRRNNRRVTIVLPYPKKN